MKNTSAAEVPIVTILLLSIVAIVIAGGVVGHKQGRKELEDYRGFLRSAERNLGEARAKADSDMRPSYEKVRANDERIEWDGGATFLFTLANNSSAPIKKLRFQAQLTQYNPVFQIIAKESGRYEFDAPLQPGDSRRVSISSNDSSAWGGSAITNSLAQTRGFGFSVFVTGAEGVGVIFKEKEGYDSSEIERYEKEADRYREEIKKRQ